MIRQRLQVAALAAGMERTDTESQGSNRERVQAVKELIQTDRLIEASHLLHRDSIETLYLLVSVPVSRFAAWSAGPVPVATYRVPGNQTLELNGLALFFSESVLMQSNAVGWRLTIDGVRVTNFLGTPAVGFPLPATIAAEYSLGGVGSPSRPLTINPLWVGSNRLVQLEVIDLSGTIDEYVAATGVLSGRIYVNVGGDLV
jgi:hypothetical protein